MKLPNFRAWNGHNFVTPKDYPAQSLGAFFAFHDPDESGSIIQMGTGRKDRNEVEIFEGDYIEVEAEPSPFCQPGYKNLFVCRFGINRRVMKNGAWVEIVGFYYEDPYNLNEGGRYSIVQNWKGCNDLFITEVIGNIFQKPARVV